MAMQCVHAFLIMWVLHQPVGLSASSVLTVPRTKPVSIKSASIRVQELVPQMHDAKWSIIIQSAVARTVTLEIRLLCVNVSKVCIFSLCTSYSSLFLLFTFVILLM